MDKGNSIHKKSIKNTLDIDHESKRISFLDKRYYKKDGKYYPSITTILQYFPKGKFFEDWLKQVGNNADFIAKQSAEEGTQTHDLIEKYLEGKELFFLDENGNAMYSTHVWKMFLKFVDFWTTYKPKLIESEHHLISNKYKIAGTCDLIVELNGELWLLDIKTSNSLHNSYDLQIAAYVQCWNDLYPERPIHRAGLIWLKSNKHKASKKSNKIQGNGWELYESPRSIKHNWSLFKLIYRLYKLENPKENPYETNMPYAVKLHQYL